MQTIGLCALAAIMGAASVTFFTRAWMALLAGVAAISLSLRRNITFHSLSSRLFRCSTQILFYGLLLVLVFRVYLSEWGFGKSHIEQLAYFLGCLPGMVLFMKDIVARIETLFSPDDKQ